MRINGYTARMSKLGPAGEKRVITALRVPPDQLEEITRRAQARRLTRTEYMIRAALGELDVEVATLEQRIAQLEDAVRRLEDLAFSG